MLDSHTHAWGPASAAHPWTNGPLLDLVDDFDVHTVYTADRLLADMDRNGVDEAVVVGYPICDWTDNWYTLDAAAGHDRLYGIVMIDPFADDAAEQLRRCMATDGVLGVRLGAACPYDRMWETFDPSVTWLRDAIEETEFWDAAVETDAAVQILCDHGQLDQALELVEAYPELTYLFDHFAHAGPETPTDETFGQFADLAEYDSVAVKVSEIVHMSDSAFPYADMYEHVRWLLETFGRERVIWGSDYPNVSDAASYAEAINWLGQVDSLSDADREWLTGRSFRRHVGLD
ncbi:Predicted metal-dependent hydrolase, TIM-barrel fold [Natronoarchaeum philippinense]|uniref:Predicted metal-dependent hydrolase, TIM-barrel fold n=1 Tax=Natronoarchaeum philippinense TaxID=558529 RepID=A0A285P1Y2_NATPI|nr:L-rhamnono-1,4-lactonase [Natronoarchaeum philippinense]SNZ15173.1 Predicted metal-dependent hydrolase, TIM-barrel fold [Natronoarchaeum philippinense]